MSLTPLFYTKLVLTGGTIYALGRTLCGPIRGPCLYGLLHYTTWD